jgi:hypothetical protein
LAGVSIEDIVEGIVAYERKNWFADYLYSKTLDESGYVRDELDNITPEYLDQIVRPYLVCWGQMATIVNNRHIEWKELADGLREKRNSLRELANYNIMCDFNEKVKENIENLYAALNLKWPYTNNKAKERTAVIGPTAVSKILHLLNPRLFVMWDKKIRGIIYENTPESYTKFLIKQRETIERALELENVCIKSDDEVAKLLRSRLSEHLTGQRYGDRILTECNCKKLAKLIDEYNVTNPTPNVVS